VEPIRYVDSVGGYSIAYQVLGDGPLDIVFVHGWVCSFQPGWEWPALASFYRRLAGMGRLILFDKRGTGLSDRVLGIASPAPASTSTSAERSASCGCSACSEPDQT
jgi:pimeloyl-ACP methyl ester carboxylesterase